MQGFIGIDKILKFKHLMVALCFLVSMGGKKDETHSIMMTILFLIIDLLTLAYRKKPNVMKLYYIFF